MRNFSLSGILKTILVLCLATLAALLAWAIVLYVLGMDLQWWTRAIILVCLGATIVMILLFRKMWLKKKEMKFVDGIVGSDMPGNISAIDDASREVKRRFREAVTTLKKSHLKGKGNPLYVLPWYLVVGRSGSGKSTAIKSARLPSPFGDINRISGVEGTRNCDWWFFDDSVVIDTAGRYSVHRNEELDKSEWHAFLEHLVRYRKKEPINGIIVTVEADQILRENPETIEEEGRILRKRIDEVIHVMGAKFPIYLMITKCDLVSGINRFCRLLPESARDQAMGAMNHDGETDIARLVDKTMDAVVNKLKDIRLILAGRDEVRGRHHIDPDVMVFPEEMERLRNGLMVFCKGAFKDNPFQELPPLRGIYFSSGCQSGIPVTAKNEDAAPRENRELPGTGYGYFLHDFFAKILPADRHLYAMTQSARQWNRITHNLWLTGFITVVVICGILLTHSWNENKAAINTISPDYRETILFTEDPVHDIDIVADFGRQIKQLKTINANRRMPRLGLNASIRLEEQLKQRYVKRFYERFEAGIHSRIEKEITEGGWEQNQFEPAVRYIPFLARRINLVKARFAGADREELSRMPDPDYSLMIQMENTEGRIRSGEALDRYRKAYIDYLTWQKDPNPMNRSLAGMQRLLDNYFSEERGDLRWLTTWANDHLRGDTVTLRDFWGGNINDPDRISVPPAFTNAGRELIGRFVTDELNAAVDGSLRIANARETFETWYRRSYYDAWMAFCNGFSRGLDLFETNRQKDNALERLAGNDSPYLRLIDVLNTELFPDKDSASWPDMQTPSGSDDAYADWLRRVGAFGTILHAARQTRDEDDSGGSPLLEHAGREAQRQAQRRMGRRTRFAASMTMEHMDEQTVSRSLEAYDRYQEALAEFSGITASRTVAHRLAKAGFEDNPGDARSPLFAAKNAVSEIKGLLDDTTNPVSNPSDERGDPLWRMIGEPVDLLWQYAVNQAGCRLQETWDESVISRVRGIGERRRVSSMLFEGGLIDDFMSGPARPFMRQSSARGFFPRQQEGAAIAFRPGFFHYLRAGRNWETIGEASGGSHTLTIEAFPTGVNPEARIKPYMTRLILESGSDPHILENRQFPVRRTFHWSPADDGAVALEILFENMTLRRTYTGYCAFGRFLNEFSEGTRIFSPDDFPDRKTELKRIGVTEIEVRFRIPQNQAQPVIRLKNALPGGPPGRIVACN